MKKSMFLSIIVFALLFTNTSLVKAESQSAFIIDDGYLSSYIGDEKNIVIPNGVKVIGEGAFEQCDTIETVKIGGQVERIEYEAFNDCINLKSVVITAPVKVVGGYAFSGCEKLERLQLPKSIIEFGQTYPAVDTYSKLNAKWNKSGKMVVNGSVLLYAGKNKKKITVPEGVKAVQYGSFSDTTENLQEVKLPKSMESLCDDCFDYARNLKKVILPKKMFKIGANAFRGTKWLKEKQKKDKLVVSNGILIDASKASGKVTIPKTVKIIASQAFSGNNKVTEIIMHSSVVEMDSFSIWFCKKLKKIVFSSSLDCIKEYTVSDCIVEDIIIPKGAKRVERFAIEDNHILGKITVDKSVRVEELAFPESAKVVYE